MTITFSGGSDDLVEISMPSGDHELNVYPNDREAANLMFDGEIRSQDEASAVRVRAFFDGTWFFAVARARMLHDVDVSGDGLALPDWPIRVVNCPDCDYSTQLEIDVPDDVPVRLVVHYPRGESS